MCQWCVAEGGEAGTGTVHTDDICSECTCCFVRLYWDISIYRHMQYGPVSISLFLLLAHSVTRTDTCLPLVLHAVPASAPSTAQVFDIHDLSAWSYSETHQKGRERGKIEDVIGGNEEKEIMEGRGEEVDRGGKMIFPHWNKGLLHFLKVCSHTFGCIAYCRWHTGGVR